MYTILKFPSDGLMLTMHPRYGQQLWALSKLTRKHKNDDCAICKLSVGDVAFRPITNLGNRMERICQRHLTMRAADWAKPGSEKTVITKFENGELVDEREIPPSH